MTQARLEHVNLTVSEPARTAQTLRDIFGWRVRWEGSAMGGAGHTVHVGEDGTYIALYAPKAGTRPFAADDGQNGLNHVAVVVDDLDAVERRVEEAGFRAFNHGAYEPGRRFYFLDADGIEYEVVSYS